MKNAKTTILLSLIFSTLTSATVLAANPSLAETTKRYMSARQSNLCSEPKIVRIRANSCQYFFELQCGLLVKVNFNELDDITFYKDWGHNGNFDRRLVLHGNIEAFRSATNTLEHYAAFNLVNYDEQAMSENIWTRLKMTFQQLRRKCA